MTFARTLMMTLVSLLTITAAQTVEADIGGHLLVESTGIDKSSPKIAHRMRTDIGGHLMIESSGIDKSSPKIAHRMRTDIGGHLMIESSGIDKSSPKIAHRTLQTKGGKVISKALLPKCKGCGTRHGKPHCPVLGTKSSFLGRPPVSKSLYPRCKGCGVRHRRPHCRKVGDTKSSSQQLAGKPSGVLQRLQSRGSQDL